MFPPFCAFVNQELGENFRLVSEIVTASISRRICGLDTRRVPPPVRFMTLCLFSILASELYKILFFRIKSSGPSFCIGERQKPITRALLGESWLKKTGATKQMGQKGRPLFSRRLYFLDYGATSSVFEIYFNLR